MIIPARWYAGGKGLTSFRGQMLGDSHIRELVDYSNSSDCFPGVNVAGGICYFLWDYSYTGACRVSNMNGSILLSEMTRPLGEYTYFVRNNRALEIIRKVLTLGEALMNTTVLSRNYFGLPTTIDGERTPFEGGIRVLTSKGDLYIKRDCITDDDSLLGKYKVVITYAMSGGNKPSADGKYQVLSSLMVLKPNEVCSETYLILGAFNSENEADNLVKYMSGQFARFLLLQALTSIHITKDRFCFVPIQDFSKTWTDKLLYEKYDITEAEIDVIGSLTKPMLLEDDDE